MLFDLRQQHRIVNRQLRLLSDRDCSQLGQLSLGYLVVGVIPGYALNFDSSVLESTTVMYKDLSETAP